MLTRDQVEQYHREGYIAVPNVYPLEQMEELRAVTDEFVQKSRAVTEHTEVYDLEPGHTPEKPLLRRLKNPVKQHPAYDRCLRDEHMLDLVSQLIGPAIRYQNTKLNLKSGDFGSAVEWHQDIAFYPHTNENVLAVGICLDDMAVENGALMVIPRSHQGPLYDHHQDGYFVGAITDPRFTDAGAVPLQVRAGGITIHHARMVHGSAPNHSNRPRRLMLFEFRANDAWPLLGVKDWNEFNAMILRGEPVWEPRVEVCPVRIPLPNTPTTGSIYESQTYLREPVMARR
jgi:ectoine hydroxylase-related dioxygenase (phytanoyl-CoA dioxygenase family)